MFPDYDKFKKEYEVFEEWKENSNFDLPKLTSNNEKVRVLPVDNDGNFYDPTPRKVVKPTMENGTYKLEVTQIKNNDLVNSPSHYTRGSQECIDTIEDAIQDAPTVITGNLQSYALKYLIRLWLKENPLRDAKKARWYLDRLISKLEVMGNKDNK